MPNRSPFSVAHLDTVENWKRMDRITRRINDLEDDRQFLLEVATWPMHSQIREQAVIVAQNMDYESYKVNAALRATRRDADVGCGYGSADWMRGKSQSSDPVEMDERVKQMFGIKE